MAKRGRLPLSATAQRVAHTKQKPKPRFVSKAHREEGKGEDPLAYEDVRRVLQRADSARKRPKG